jgi:hypothetical protein
MLSARLLPFTVPPNSIADCGCARALILRRVVSSEIFGTASLTGAPREGAANFSGGGPCACAYSGDSLKTLSSTRLFPTKPAPDQRNEGKILSAKSFHTSF